MPAAATRNSKDGLSAQSRACGTRAFDWVRSVGLRFRGEARRPDRSAGLGLTRRSFLALPCLAAAPKDALAAAASQPRLVELLRCPVAGLSYYDYGRVADRLVAGTGLVLQREPGNPHDPRAIAVFTADAVKLGYVPRIDNAALASLMDAGYDLRARVRGLGRAPWNRLWMTVNFVAVPAANRATWG